MKKNLTNKINENTLISRQYTMSFMLKLLNSSCFQISVRRTGKRRSKKNYQPENSTQSYLLRQKKETYPNDSVESRKEDSKPGSRISSLDDQLNNYATRQSKKKATNDSNEIGEKEPEPQPGPSGACGQGNNFIGNPLEPVLDELASEEEFVSVMEIENCEYELNKNKKLQLEDDIRQLQNGVLKQKN